MQQSYNQFFLTNFFSIIIIIIISSPLKALDGKNQQLAQNSHITSGRINFLEPTINADRIIYQPTPNN